MGNSCVKTRQGLGANGECLLDISMIDKGYLLLRTHEQVSQEEIAKIIDRSKEILRENSDNSQAHLTLGICLYFIGFVEAAETQLIKSRQLMKSYQSSFVLGLINMQKENLKEAQDCFKASLIEQPALNTFVKISEVLLRRDKLSKARRYAKKGLKLYCNDSELITIIGMSYLPSDIERANKYTMKAIKNNPGLFKPYINIAEIRKAQEKYKSAKKYYKLAISKGNNTQKGYAQLLLSSLYFELGHLEHAINYCKASISSNPDLINLMRAKGFDSILENQTIHHAIEDIINTNYSQAIHSLKSLKKRNQATILTTYFLALAYQEANEAEKAKHYYRKVVKIGLDDGQNDLSRLLLLRAQKILNEIQEEVVEEESEVKGLVVASVGDELGSEEIASEEESALATIEGSYPGFNEALKLEAMDEGTPVNLITYEPPKIMMQRRGNTLKQFASSTDTQPGNCSIY